MSRSVNHLFAATDNPHSDCRALLTQIDAPYVPPSASPLTILIAGQGNAGKSSVLNALAGTVTVPTGRINPTTEFYTIGVDHPLAGKLVLVDSPGVSTKLSEAWLEKMRQADLVIWTTAANRSDRAADQNSLSAIRSIAKDDIRLREIPVVLAVTHADQLNPPSEWLPPYDLLSGERAKELNMRAALSAVSKSLGIEPKRSVIVSVRDPGSDAWNIESLWACIQAARPEAQQKQFERGHQQEGRLKVAIDFARSIPTFISGAIDFIKR